MKKALAVITSVVGLSLVPASAANAEPRPGMYTYSCHYHYSPVAFQGSNWYRHCH